MSDQPESPKDTSRDLEVMLQKVPNKFYCNGFTNYLGLSDVNLVMMLNNAPIASVNMSYTTAKTLAEKLANLISILEEQNDNQKILTTGDVENLLKRKKEAEVEGN